MMEREEGGVARDTSLVCMGRYARVLIISRTLSRIIQKEHADLDSLLQKMMFARAGSSVRSSRFCTREY